MEMKGSTPAASTTIFSFKFLMRLVETVLRAVSSPQCAMFALPII
jgi:hypothetical protein